MKKVDILLEKMIAEDFQAFLAFQRENIFYITGFMPSSFSFVLINENPVLFASAMDMELAKKNSQIPAVLFESFSQVKDILKESFNKKSILAIEGTLDYQTSNIFSNDFKIDSSDLLANQRMIKDKKEIKLIEEATDIAQKSFKELELTGREWELAHDLGYLMRKNGAYKESFDTIIATGSNSSLPHAVTTDKEIEYPILIDWGAYANYYCSDNTRTYIQSEKEEEIFDIVLEAYNASIKTVKPGVKASDVDKVARDVITEYGYGDNYIHSTGHGVGLEVHEKPNVSIKSDTVLEKNMVITIEPGIYLEGKFGIRLEDTIYLSNKANVIGNLAMKL